MSSNPQTSTTSDPQGATPSALGARGDPDVPARPRFRYRLEGAALGAAERVVPLLPRSVALGVARVLGSLAYYVLAEDRRVALANLDLVYRDTKSRAEKKRIARATFHNLAANLVGLFWAPRLTAENIHEYAEGDFDTLRAILARGKGVIFITPHYGDWELMSLAAGFIGTPYVTVMEPSKNPAVSTTISRLRSLSGHTMVEPRFAVIKLYKTIARGGTIGLLVDVNARRGRGGVWLDFFGVPVFNSAAVAELAIKTGAPIVFGYGLPLPGPGRRIRLTVLPEIQPANTGDKEKDVLATSQKCLDCCADLIRQHPEHWLWTYKRWKRKPAPDAPGHPFYAKYDPNT